MVKKLSRENMLGADKKDNVLLSVITWAIIVCLLVYIFLRSFVFSVIVVSGDSMLPNFYDGEVLLGDTVMARRGAYTYGDVVIINTGKKIEGEDKIIIKRVIGLGGDTVDIRDGYVYVNNEAVDEYYLPDNVLTNEVVNEVTFPIVLEDDEIFVLGDNRAISADSRYLKYSPIKTGQVCAVIPDWTLNNNIFVKLFTYNFNKEIYGKN